LMCQLKTALLEDEDDPSIEGDISVEVAGSRVSLSLTQALDLHGECLKILTQFALEMHKQTINASNN
jgi:hypothetical protein